MTNLYEQKRNPGLGLLLMLLTSAIFWGSVASCAGYMIRSHQENAAIRLACEKLLEYGWEVSMDECVKELRP